MKSRTLKASGITVFVTALLLTAVPVPLEAQSIASETIILNVEGMWNQDCEEYIADSLLGDIEGIQEVRADHESDSVSVDFDPARTSAEEIAVEIEDCPFFDVTGSETHELDEDLIEKSRSSCCNFGCRNRGV